ncbi:MAG TPA: hypothetical protein VFE63_04900 [Roseiarcus sp.]|jgi:nitric oxide reductase subunit B|nr:hypothetical protein [Roseiarcus sp.]
MRRELQGVDLTKTEVTLPQELAAAIETMRSDMADNLGKTDLATGWTPAYSLSHAEALQTADFITYSVLTTVARRPDTTWSGTENWPFEPEVGNTPTTNTFIWNLGKLLFHLPDVRRGRAAGSGSAIRGSRTFSSADSGRSASFWGSWSGAA